MKNFKVYQLPVEHAAKFMGLEFVTKHNILPKLEDYKMVYEGEFEPQGEYSEPDQLYMKFQGEKPEGYTGHSISMSDVVEIDGKYFYCDDYGWEEVFFQTEDENKSYLLLSSDPELLKAVAKALITNDVPFSFHTDEKTTYIECQSKEDLEEWAYEFTCDCDANALYDIVMMPTEKEIDLEENGTRCTNGKKIA